MLVGDLMILDMRIGRRPIGFAVYRGVARVIRTDADHKGSAFLIDSADLPYSFDRLALRDLAQGAAGDIASRDRWRWERR